MKTTKLAATEAAKQFPVEDAFGFAGTVLQNSRDDSDQGGLSQEAAKRLWAKACAEVADAFGEKDSRVLVNFLRAPIGRHLADEVYNQAFPRKDEAALAAAIRPAVGRTTPGGKGWWKKPFAEVRKATLNGTWAD